MIKTTKKFGSTNSPSRGKAVTTPNKSKSGSNSSKSGTVKPNGSTNSPGRGK